MSLPVPDLTPLSQINEDDILEFVQGDLSPRQDNIATDVCDLTISYKVPGSKLVPFLMWMLGVDYVDSLNQLRRTCPAFHPVYPWAWCKSVQIQGQGFDGDDIAKVIYEFQNTPAKWKQYVAQCTFEMPTYNVYYDDEVSNEYSRFLSKEFFPNTELVSVDGGTVNLDGNGGDAFNGKPSLQIVTRRETAGIKLTWMRVPLAYVQPDDDSLPLKLMQIQGRTNDATFLGREAETLLCKDVKLKKYVSPLTTNNVGQLYFLYDIEINLLWYDPEPKGKSGETRHGWNFFLHSNLQYYYATSSGGKKIFHSCDFTKAFTHYSDLMTLT